jgi:hypothetical protein
MLLDSWQLGVAEVRGVRGHLLQGKSVVPHPRSSSSQEEFHTRTSPNPSIRQRWNIRLARLSYVFLLGLYTGCATWFSQNAPCDLLIEWCSLYKGLAGEHCTRPPLQVHTPRNQFEPKGGWSTRRVNMPGQANWTGPLIFRGQWRIFGAWVYLRIPESSIWL